MDKNKLFLIYPPISKRERYSSDIGHAGGSQIPLGIYYLASYMRQNNFIVKAIDAETLKLDSAYIIQQIKDFEPAYVGISSTTVAFHRAFELAKEIRRQCEDIVLLIGGPHVTANPVETINTGLFNYGIIGEGEITLLQLLQSLNKNFLPKDIDGLVYLDNDNQPYSTQKREFIKLLDELPFPAYDLIDDISLYNPPPSNYKTLPVINIITSRGCPFHCTFCDKNIFGNKYRKRSPQNIVDEIKYLKENYYVNEFAFVDDTFLLDKNRIYELFKLLNDQNIKFPWTCMSRINKMDYDFLKFIKSNGCWHISFGIESGNQDILKLIQKGITLDEADIVIRRCRKLGIKTKGFFIIGHPTETLETINQTIKFTCKLKLDDIVVTLNTPIPGSKQYEETELYGHLDKTDWSEFNYWRPVFIPKGLSKDILLKKHREIYRKFYLRPSALFRYFLSFFGKGGYRRFLSVLKASFFMFKKVKE